MTSCVQGVTLMAFFSTFKVCPKYYRKNSFVLLLEVPCYHYVQNFKLIPLRPLQKQWSFPWRISSVNLTKSAVSCGFGYIYWTSPSWKTSFLCSGSCAFLSLFQWKKESCFHCDQNCPCFTFRSKLHSLWLKLRFFHY